MTPEHLDLERFRAHLLAADRAGLAGDAAAEAGELRAGLALWRGPVLVDAPSDSLQRAVVPMLVEERLAALQRRIAIDFSLGLAGALIAELRGLTEEYPLREWFWARLMLALHRCDRQAEALATYETVRRRLVDELGIEPGRELRQVHAHVLAGDLRPTTVPARRARREHCVPVPPRAGDRPRRRGLPRRYPIVNSSDRAAYPAFLHESVEFGFAIPRPPGNEPPAWSR
jgi:DNA-binding SARP family transcriptional activator